LTTGNAFVKSAKNVAHTSPDNGGTVVTLTMTWKKEFNSNTNNADLLAVACMVA
jgi:hypothetical protein